MEVREQAIRVLNEIIEDNEDLSIANLIYKIFSIHPEMSTKTFKELSDYELLDILIETQADLGA